MNGVCIIDFSDLNCDINSTTIKCKCYMWICDTVLG